jgi:phage recombination protein Bet
MPKIPEFTQDDLAAIQLQILRPRNRKATKEETLLFARQCQRTGLDPFARQIYGQFRFDKKRGDEVMAVQATIDGLRAVAEDSGCYAGQPEPEYYDGGRWVEVWPDRTKQPVAARVTVRKVIGGILAETRAVAHWSEYYDANSPMWKDKPALMLGKCAEALALRKAFPNVLSGIYTAEEMGRVDVEDVPAPSGEAPRAAAGVPPGRGSDITQPGDDPRQGPHTVEDLVRENAEQRAAEGAAKTQAPDDDRLPDGSKAMGGEVLFEAIKRTDITTEDLTAVLRDLGLTIWPHGTRRDGKVAHLDAFPREGRYALATRLGEIETAQAKSEPVAAATGGPVQPDATP